VKKRKKGEKEREENIVKESNKGLLIFVSRI
jgi:hypothetical protein